MKPTLNLRTVFLFSFIIWFSVFYFGVTIWREHALNSYMATFPYFSEEERHQSTEELRESEKEKLKTVKFEPPLDSIFSDPLMIDYVSSAYTRSLDYQIHFFDDVLPELIRKDEHFNFFTKFFHVYGKQYSFETLRFAGFQGFASAPALSISPYSDTDFFNRMGFAIAAWEAEGNKREGDWLDRFMQSRQYAVFLAETCNEIDNPRDRNSVESMVEEIRLLPIEQSCNPLTYLKNHFLVDAKELTDIQFQAYQQHKAERDFVLASFDAEVIHGIWWHVRTAENLSPFHYSDLHMSDSFFPNPFVDLAGIFLGALTTSTVVVVMCRRRIKSD